MMNTRYVQNHPTKPSRLELFFVRLFGKKVQGCYMATGPDMTCKALFVKWRGHYYLLDRKYSKQAFYRHIFSGGTEL